MVEELKLAIKIDDATIEQSLLEQFANAQKMADKVVLDFKNVNFDDKQIEAKFKEMQKKAGQNPIDLTIGGNTLDMLGQIDKRLAEIFSIGKGKSFIDSSSIAADIGKIENKINELNKKYEESQKKLSSIGSGNVSGKDVNLVDNEEFKKLSQEVSELKNQFDDLKTHMQLLDDYTVPTDRFFELQSQVETTTVKVSDLVDEFTKLSNAQKALSSTPQESNISSGRKDAFPDKDVSASVESATNSIKEENNVLEQNTQKAKENAEAKEKIINAYKEVSNVNLSKYNTRLESYTKKTSGYDATIARFENGGWTSDDYKKRIDAVKEAVKQYEDILNNLKAHPELVNDEELGKLDKQEKLIKENITAVQNMSAAEKGYSFISAQKELDKINNILKEHSGMSREAKNQIKAYYAEIKSGNPSASLDVIHGKIMQIVNAEIEAGRGGKSMFDIFDTSRLHQIIAQAAGMFSLYDIINIAKQGLQTVRELDTALTEMRKVSDESLQTLKSYQKESFNTADAIATTGLQLQNSIADWQRLGYSISEADELAKNSNIYKNVGDMDISTATEHMVSSVQAWKSEFNDDAVKTSEEVMNRYNKIGNEFAISSADIGEAMETSAAALKAGGNDLNEALGIITAGNIIQQDASTTSSAMKILSLRIRGAKSDLESMGESTDDLADSTSKLREEIKGLTGVDIMADEDTFKSTAEIIKEIGAVWDQMTDVSRAATLEKLAGKNRASTVAGLIENYKTIDKVIEAASNADNSALEENQKIIESIDGRIQQLQNRVQEFWYNAINDSVVKDAVSALTFLVDGATKLIDTFGLLPTILSIVAAKLSFKNVGINTLVAY
nr:MAG TPA: minor tail protein [Caudoviricetes sp.]